MFKEDFVYPLNLVNAGIMNPEEIAEMLGSQTEEVSELELVNRRIIELMQE